MENAPLAAWPMARYNSPRPSQEATLVFIFVENGPLAGQSLQLSGTLTIGRQSDCDLKLPDKKASRRHAAVIASAEQVEIVDLGSRNGTLVNGRRVQRRRLQLGDVVQIGTTLLRLVEKDQTSLERRRIAGYEVLDLIGSGGMGKVYRARQVSMERMVALKVLHPHLTTDETFVAQFVREARSAGKLDHQNVIHVYDVGQDGSTYFFSMELVDGVTAAKLLQGGPLFPLQVIDIGLAIARALQYAHEQGIVHGDVKPQNIMVSRADVKLADLGLARSMSQPDSLRDRHPRRAWGTPKYIAPELGTGAQPDPRSDIYSLGATLYHMLIGYAPFAGSTGQELLRKHMYEPLTPLRELNPNAPVALARAVEKMLAKKPEERQQSMRQVIDDLVEARSAAVLVGGPAREQPGAYAVQPAERSSTEEGTLIDTALQRRRRRRWVYLTLALLAILLSAGAGLAAYFYFTGLHGYGYWGN